MRAPTDARADAPRRPADHAGVTRSAGAQGDIPPGGRGVGRWFAAVVLLCFVVADAVARHARSARHALVEAARRGRSTLARELDAASRRARALREQARPGVQALGEEVAALGERVAALGEEVAALGEQARQHAGPWWRSIRQRTAPAARALGWWLAWALVVAIEVAEQAGRACVRAWRASAAFTREEVQPRARTAGRVGRAWHGRAEVLADRAVTLAAIRAHRWTERGRDRAAVATTRAAQLHVPRAWAWTGPRARSAARIAGATTRRALPRPGLLASVAVSGAGVAALTVGAVVTLTPPAVDSATRAADVAIVVPHEMPRLPEPSDLVDAQGTRLATLHDAEYRRVVALDEVPQHVRQAVIAAEDRRFHEHDGYDAVAIGRAFEANIEATGVVQGGSTITQQLAKLNFVGEDRTVDRKVRELVQAVGLEEAYTKDELLERYLNQVYFGAGAYGIAAAAEEFFRADAADLTVAQAAMLAGQIRAPGAFDPRSDPLAAQARRGQVLERMLADGAIDREEARAAHDEPVEVAPPLDHTPAEPHVVEAVKREFVANPAFGETVEERWEALLGGGLVIETTLHPQQQALAHEVVDEHVQALGGPTAALAAIEPGTGRVLAAAGGGDFADTQFDFATQSRRQPGSAFKTFTLVAALERGVEPGVELEGDSPQEHSLPHDQTWTVHNFGDSSHGTVDLREALVRSINTAFAELTVDIGHDAVIDVATRLGVAEAAFGEPSSHGPSVSLGGLTHGVSPLEMAAAYGAIAAGGAYAEPFLVERVTDGDGEVLYEREIETTRAIDEDVADATLDMLQDVVQSGTGTAARIPGWPVAGKTGTTQNSADAWFAGAVNPLAVAVWIGHPDEQTPIPGLTGGGMAAPIWHDFVSRAVADRDTEAFGE